MCSVQKDLRNIAINLLRITYTILILQKALQACATTTRTNNGPMEDQHDNK